MIKFKVLDGYRHEKGKVILLTGSSQDLTALERQLLKSGKSVIYSHGGTATFGLSIKKQQSLTQLDEMTIGKDDVVEFLDKVRRIAKKKGSFNFFDYPEDGEFSVCVENMET